jgi:2-hydroxychromene-2-carboxylate isomerase
MAMTNATAQHTGPADYIAREASKGRHAYHLAASRKQGPDARAQADELTRDTAEGVTRARWAMDGSYGSEYAHAIQAALLAELASVRTPLQIARAYRNAGQMAHRIAALMDYCDINARGITAAYKRAGYGTEQFAALNDQLADLARSYYTTEEA